MWRSLGGFVQSHCILLHFLHSYGFDEYLNANDAKNWLIGKDPDEGKDWKLEEKGTIEEEVVGWHHQINGHEFEQTMRGSKGQESLACCSPWGHKESHMTEQLKDNDNNDFHIFISYLAFSLVFNIYVANCLLDIFIWIYFKFNYKK